MAFPTAGVAAVLDALPPLLRGSASSSSNANGSVAAAGTEREGFFAAEVGGFIGGKRPLPDDMLLDATVSSSCSKMGTWLGLGLGLGLGSGFRLGLGLGLGLGLALTVAGMAGIV